MPRELRVKTGIKVDASQLRRHLALWTAALGKTAQEAVKQQAGLLAQDMLSYTLPLDGQPGGRRGESLAARDVGIASMNRDIERIFKPFEKASYQDVASNNDYNIFAQYVSARQRANLPIPKYVEKAFKGYGDEVKVWMQFRSAYGYGGGRKGGKAYFSTVNGDGMSEAHVARRGGTDVDDYAKKVGKSKDVYFVADRDRKVAQYERKMAGHVGRMKAAWLEIGWKLGRKMRAPGWIAAHVGGGNYILEDKSGNVEKPEITIGNAIQGKMTKSPGRDLWKAAVNHRAYAMRVDILNRLRTAARGSETGVLQMAERLGLPVESTDDT